MLVWNSRHILDNNYFLFISIAYFFVGTLDLTHTLAYKGMGVFSRNDTNLATQLWIATRYMESISLFVAPLTFGRKLKGNHIFLAYFLISAVLLATIFYWEIFPVCFVEGAGLTAFKKLSEYVICLILSAAILPLYQNRRNFDATIYQMLVLSILLTICSELAFTTYVHAYGIANLIGHYLEIVSIYLVYNALIVSGLTKPYAVLFRDLQQSEISLRKAHEELEMRVDERTAELSTVNKRLQTEINGHTLARAELHKNKDMLKNIFDGILDPLIVLDENMVTKTINIAAMKYYNVSSLDEVIGKPCYQAFKSRSEPCESCKIPQMLTHEKDISIERKGFSGPFRVEKIILYPLNQQNGMNKEFILRIHDITERKLFEKQLIQNEKLTALGVLVSSIAHEVNNPNNFISFNLPILRDYLNEMLPIVDAFADEHPDFEPFNLTYPEFRQDIFNILVNIENGSKRITNFASNLREYSQDGNRDRKSGVLSELNAIVDRAHSICRGKMKRSVKRFIKNIPEDLPSIYTEPHVLEQILINLLLNAIQATNKDDSWIRLNASVGNGDKNQIRIEVSDNGCGMDEQTQLKIFDPFYTTKSHAEGTGLGLFVCHNLIKKINGVIEVESEPDQGSVFRILLPTDNRHWTDGI